MIHTDLLNLQTSQFGTWWTILRISLEERLVYRGDFALGTLMRFLPIVTQIFLWFAVFESVRAAGGKESIAGYSYHDFVAYYLLTMLSRAFSSMPGLSSGIAMQVRQGEIKKYLVQPIDLLGFLLLSRIAHKLAYYSVAIGPFALVFFLCRNFFPGWPDATTMCAYIASLLMAFLLGYFLESCIGLISFWFLEVSSLVFIYMLMSFFLSGHMFPLDMLPAPWSQIVSFLPFQYLAYFPSAVFLKKVVGAELALGLAVQLGWVVFLYRPEPRDVRAWSRAIQRIRRLNVNSNAAILFASVYHIRSEQPRSRHDLSVEFLARVHLVDILGRDERWLLSSDIQLRQGDRSRCLAAHGVSRRIRLGPLGVLRLFGDDNVRQQYCPSFLYAERARV